MITEEKAMEYAETVYAISDTEDVNLLSTQVLIQIHTQKAFVDGANWQKEQMRTEKDD